MSELEPPYLRSIHPPYRLTPRSAVAQMPSEDEPPGFLERFIRMARKWLA